LSRQTVVVYGAYGHTARFVIAELEDRGLAVARSGRDAAKLSELAGRDGSDLRVATVDDASSLDALSTVPPPLSIARGRSPNQRRP
jgi:short subunit dehydrogenase-like uncharacterized protein